MKKPSKPLHARGELRSAIRRQPVVFAVYLVLRLIVLASLVSAILRQEYESAFVCVLVLFLFMLPFFIQKNFGIRLPSTLEIIILLFIFAAEILGELQSYFIQYPYWDTMLHTTNGFLCAAVGFSLIDILNRDAKIKFTLSPVYVALAAFYSFGIINRIDWIIGWVAPLVAGISTTAIFLRYLYQVFTFGKTPAQKK